MQILLRMRDTAVYSCVCGSSNDSRVDSQSCPIHVENTSTHKTSTWRGRCHLNMCWLSVNGVDVCWLPGRNGPEWKLSVLTSARILPPWTLVMSCFLDVATTMLSKFMFFCFRFFPHFFLCTLLVLLHSLYRGRKKGRILGMRERNGGWWIANYLQPQKWMVESGWLKHELAT